MLEGRSLLDVASAVGETPHWSPDQVLQNNLTQVLAATPQ